MDRDAQIFWSTVSETELTGIPLDQLRRQYASALARKFALSFTLLLCVAVEPALAADSGVCTVQKLPTIIEGFFQLTTGVGIVGLAVVWQADSLVDIFTFNPEQKRALKQHKRSATKSATILVVLGPLYTVAGSMMGLPLAECVDFIPW